MPTPRARPALFQLARALRDARALRIRFVDTERATVERTLDVAALSFDPPRWLLAAWSADRDVLRLVDVARVLAVRRTRRRARPPPAGFDPLDFALHRILDPAAGPARPLAVAIPAPWPEVAPALLPTARVEPAPGGGILRVRASRPDVLAALAASLSPAAAIHSEPSPCPAPAEQRRSDPRPAATRPGSSGSSPGSSTSPSPRAAPGSTRRSPTPTGGSRTRRRRCSRGTRRR